jgi:E3 ubiquitin-protein ligase RNF1/2
MPAQKRSHETTPPLPEEDEEDSLHNCTQSHDEDAEDGEDDAASDSDGSLSSSGDKDEFVMVKLAEIRKEVQCPICLGIIRKTRTVMECLHRFCQECIDKSMRLGNNECPACRTHCASRRSLRDDPNYDALIAVLYPDIDKYEEEELAFHEEEKARNKQIQASIAQTLRRQSEALSRKQPMRRSLANYRNSRRRNQRGGGQAGSDNEEDANGQDGIKDSSYADERCTETKPTKRQKRWGSGARFSSSQPCLAASSCADGCDDDDDNNNNDSEANREPGGASAGLVCGSAEMLAWGRGGTRSHTRYGSIAAGNGKNARYTRLSKLHDCLRSSVDNDDELDIHLLLISLDEQKIPSLEKPNLCCKPAMSVKHICQYVAVTSGVKADEVEMLLVKELDCKLIPSATQNVSAIIDPCKDELHMLEEHETLMELQTMTNFNQRHLIFAYRQKLSG